MREKVVRREWSREGMSSGVSILPITVGEVPSGADGGKREYPRTGMPVIAVCEDKRSTRQERDRLMVQTEWNREAKPSSLRGDEGFLLICGSGERYG